MRVILKQKVKEETKNGLTHFTNTNAKVQITIQ